MNGYPWYEPSVVTTRMEGSMLHLAVLMQPDDNAQAMERSFDYGRIVMVDYSGAAIKRRVAARISADPTEKWMIFSGNTVASADVNVTTSQVRFWQA